MRSPDTNVISLPRVKVTAPPSPRWDITDRTAFDRWVVSTREELIAPDAATTKGRNPEQWAAYNLGRQQHHHQLQLVSHPAFEQAHQALTTQIQAAHGAGLDGTGIALIGPSMSGKTTLLYSVMAAQHHTSQLPTTMDPDADHVPVLYLIAGAEATAKQLLQAGLRFYSERYVTDEAVNVLQDRLHTLIRSCGTNLVVIDEIHRVRPIDSQRRPTGDILRGIQNHTTATIIVAGVTDHVGGVFDPYKDWGTAEADQLRRRFEVVHLAPYDPYKDEDDLLLTMQRVWKQLILLKEPTDVADSALATYAQVLLEASGGRIGSLVRQLVRAANIAIATSEERLTKRNLGV